VLAAAVERGASVEDLTASFKPFASGEGAVALLFDALAAAGFKAMIKSVKTYDALVKSACPDTVSQEMALEWLETFAAAKLVDGENPKAVAKALHTMYELDQLGEEVVLAWHSRAMPLATPLVESVKTAVQPIIDWLEESEEESEEED
jgi:hypothetical protein